MPDPLITGRAALTETRSVRFERAWRGYCCEHVDRFLRDLSVALDLLLTANESLLERCHAAEQAIEEAGWPEQLFKDALVAADRIRETSARERDEILACAREEATTLEQEARRKVVRAQRTLDQVRTATSRLRASYHTLLAAATDLVADGTASESTGSWHEHLNGNAAAGDLHAAGSPLASARSHVH